MNKLSVTGSLARKVLVTIMLSVFSFKATAQQKTTTEQNQVWIGYITSTMISSNYSIWNDTHYIPEGFFIIRTGLTRHFTNTAVTAGYAYALTPPGDGNTTLERKEHRPWGQLQFVLPVNKSLILTHRVRYDARFRQNVDNAEVIDGYTYYNRIRFMISLKQTLGTPEGKSTIPYISIADEVLLNFGDDAYNTFDQNRLSLNFGLQKKYIQYQLGLMNRYVQSAPGKYVLNHTLVFWVTQKFDLKNFFAKHHIQGDGDGSD